MDSSGVAKCKYYLAQVNDFIKRFRGLDRRMDRKRIFEDTKFVG